MPKERREYRTGTPGLGYPFYSRRLREGLQRRVLVNKLSLTVFDTVLYDAKSR